MFLLLLIFNVLLLLVLNLPLRLPFRLPLCSHFMFTFMPALALGFGFR